MASTFTPLQLNVAAGMLQNQGFAANSNVISSIVQYDLLDPIVKLSEIFISGASVLSTNTLAELHTLSSNTCAALTNSYPPTASFGSYGYSGNLLAIAYTYMGDGDLSKFAQYFTTAYGYVTQTNVILNSSLNSKDYLGPTYTNMNNLISSDITSVNLATSAFGDDLLKLGLMIDLNNLGNLGSPAALVSRLFQISGTVVTSVTAAFIAVGVPHDIVFTLVNEDYSVTDEIQKLMYTAMTQITDDPLQQILDIFQVTTTGITTMADLLNPVKLFPTSFQSLTAPTSEGLRAIYINSSGDVNSIMETQLPPYVLRSTA